MQEDPYHGDGLNLYAYCGNNPVTYYDPSGYAGKNYSPEIVWPSSPHKNSTPGHWETIVDQVSDYAKSGDYDKIYVNQGIKQEIGAGDFSNKRPDVIGVHTDGKIDVVEVPSLTDDIGALNDRMDYSLEQMGDRAGTGTIRNIPDEYADLPLPDTIDLPEDLKYSQPSNENDENKKDNDCKG